MFSELCFRCIKRPLIAREAYRAVRFGSTMAITTEKKH